MSWRSESLGCLCLCVCTAHRLREFKFPGPGETQAQGDMGMTGLDILLNTSSLTPLETASSLDLQLMDQTQP